MNACGTRAALLTMLAGALSLSLAAGAMGQAQPEKTPQAQPAHEVKLEPVETDGKMADQEDLVGQKARDFTLTDTEGKEHTLSSYLNEGKIVVLEWFNPRCPIVVRHYEKATTMNDLVAKYDDKDVVWLAVNSGSDGTGEGELNEEHREKWEMSHPVLLDTEGDVGRAYGSKNTPTMYVIGKDGVIAYVGAIDSDPRGRESDVENYVEAALEAVLADSNVETAYAKPYGCNIKYAKN